MSCVYIAIEGNIEIFKEYQSLWKNRNIAGIHANTMTEGIEKAIKIERAKKDELYFISINADNINFMPQLKILNEETHAPILIITSNPNDDEHHEALNCGADFYGRFCETKEQNVTRITASLNSIERRNGKQKPPSQVLTYGCILLGVNEHAVFVNDIAVKLTNKEFKLLQHLLANKGTTLTFEQILSYTWGNDYQNSNIMQLRNHIMRLRKKLLRASPDCDYIENVHGAGYKFATNLDMKF